MTLLFDDLRDQPAEPGELELPDGHLRWSSTSISWSAAEPKTLDPSKLYLQLSRTLDLDHDGGYGLSVEVRGGPLGQPLRLHAPTAPAHRLQGLPLVQVDGVESDWPTLESLVRALLIHGARLRTVLAGAGLDPVLESRPRAFRRDELPIELAAGLPKRGIALWIGEERVVADLSKRRLRVSRGGPGTQGEPRHDVPLYPRECRRLSRHLDFMPLLDPDAYDPVDNPGTRAILLCDGFDVVVLPGTSERYAHVKRIDAQLVDRENRKLHAWLAEPWPAIRHSLVALSFLVGLIAFQVLSEGRLFDASETQFIKVAYGALPCAAFGLGVWFGGNSLGTNLKAGTIFALVVFGGWVFIHQGMWSAL